VTESQRQRESKKQGEAVGAEQSVEGIGCCLAELATGCFVPLLVVAALILVVAAWLT
jgi:hypothetical protein